MAEAMFAPGLVSVLFYRRRPTAFQVALGAAFTIVFSGLLGYLQDAGTSRVWENVVLAIVLGLVLYAVILVYFVYVYYPKRARAAVATDPPAQPRSQ